MTAEDKVCVIALIRSNLRHSRYIYYWSSYTLKEVFERLSGCYISNEDFKELMNVAGFEATARSSKAINHRYKLEVIPSQQISPYFWGCGCQRKYL